MTEVNVTMDVGSDGVALITISNPPVNALALPNLIVNEACRVLEEGVVVRASDLDVASVLGMSFPSYRGGIVFWGDLVGPKHIYASLKKWSEKYSDLYKPSRFLEERAKNGVPLGAPLSTATSSRARL